MFQPCILIPTFNDPTTIIPLLDHLKPFGLPVIVVNDGSVSSYGELLRDQAQQRGDSMILVERKENGGKGAAVQSGLGEAIELGFSHALQIDADGQHDHTQIPEFLETAEKHPEALILGAPAFGEDVPKSRLYGRQVSRVMAWLETLSLQIEDPLFGFRVYPLKAVSRLFKKTTLGYRMDFDPEIVVRLVWQGLEVQNIKSKVRYPEGNSSHFQMVRDNLRLSWLHTRLLIGMVLRSPILIARKLK